METSTTTGLPEKIMDLFQTSKEYVEDRLELEVLKGADRIARFTSSLITFLVSLAFAIVLVLLLCIGLAIWLNQLIGSSVAGYFIVAGLVLLALVLLFTLGRNSIKRGVVDNILNTIDND